ncbi:gliding motility protein RemB [Sphingobacterium sp. Mn56C]|uniref:gliding motility protein RemB n=1 Tax=Sphingobacterium sp. Mn56C TaxID=3395261 RepID=UPI003BEAAD14
MNNIRLYLTLGMGILFANKETMAQTAYQPYSYQHYQKYNDILYSPETRLHTSVKSTLFEGKLFERNDSLLRKDPSSGKSWLMRKIFNEHLVQVEKEDHSFYLDFLPDFQMGKELMGDNKVNTWLNTRGFQTGLNVKDKFSLYVNFFENQGTFPDYIIDYSTRNLVYPGQGSTKRPKGNKLDWMYATANATYNVAPYLQVSVAYDKNHIGDGYRSVLLSDFSSNYAQLRLVGKIGNVQYTSVWAYMLDPKNPRIDTLQGNARVGDGIKWGAFQYLDYNATNRLSVGLFQAVTWANRNQAGHRGFDFNYLIPVSFLRPVESNNRSSPDKMFLGLNAKYKVLRNLTAYGQFLLGEFTAKEFFSNNGYAHNKWGAQLGIRGYDAFGVKNLNFLGEYNFVRPYTYQHFISISNYSNHGEPLAHPFGANFREVLGIANYSYKRYDFSVQGMYSLSGSDPVTGENFGGDIFQSYTSIPNMYGNKIGQGIKNNLYYADLKAAYVLNPKYNLRFEVGYTQRVRQIEGQATQKSGIISVGLRSSFRNIYTDL